jgi:hypothetical protein
MEKRWVIKEAYFDLKNEWNKKIMIIRNYEEELRRLLSRLSVVGSHFSKTITDLPNQMIIRELCASKSLDLIFWLIASSNLDFLK